MLVSRKLGLLPDAQGVILPSLVSTLLLQEMLFFAMILLFWSTTQQIKFKYFEKATKHKYFTSSPHFVFLIAGSKEM